MEKFPMKNLNKVLENASLFKKIESDHERKSYKKRCNFDEKGMSVHVATGNTIYLDSLVVMSFSSHSMKYP